MKQISRSLIIAGLLVISLYHYSAAQNWEKVADKGFGDAGNDYAWSMATFRGKLYVGTLNGMKGAQIWCSSSGEPDTWKRVYHSTPFANSGIRCLYADGNQALYAGTYSIHGGEILRTTNGRVWVPVGRSGLEDRRNNSIRCMVRFGEYLYAGTGSSEFQNNLTMQNRQGRYQPFQSYGAQLYRSKNGFTWELVETEPDFRSTKVFDTEKNTLVTNNVSIGELEIFDNMLYAFTWTMDITLQSGGSISNMAEDMLNGNFKPNFPDSTGAFEVWRSSDGVSWENVVGKDDPYGNGMGFSLKDPDPDSLKNDAVTSVAVYHEKLYLGTQNPTGKTAVWRTAEGTQWEKVVDFYQLGENFNFYIWRMIPFMDNLFIGTMNMGYIGTTGVTGSQIWVYHSDDTDNAFYNLDHNGFDGETIYMGDEKMPKNYGVRTFGILNDTLFAGTATMLSVPTSKPGEKGSMTIAGKDVGCEIWELVLSGSGDSEDLSSTSTSIMIEKSAAQPLKRDNNKLKLMEDFGMPALMYFSSF